MTKAKPKLIIIDGNALIHRSFHALPPTMTTKSGEMVNAVYGFTNVLIKAIREFNPEYVVLTFDKKGPTFRHEVYKDYKATRVKAADELYAQIPIAKKVVRAFNIPIYEKSGLEADDLIGTIVNNVNSDIEKIIVTGDMDMLQLINDNIKVYKMGRGIQDASLFDEKLTKEKYDLLPNQIIDYKALRGDPSDNIPGVRGVGEKTATDLLKQFKTLDGVYKYVESPKSKVQSHIKPRIVELLKQYKKDAYLSEKLATIKCDAKINFKLEDAKFGDFKKEDVVKLFSELEFKSLLPRVQGLGSKEQETKNKEQGAGDVDKFERNKKMFKYILVDNDKKFKLFLKKLKKQSRVLGITFDTETSSFDTITADLLGISFSWIQGEAYYIQLRITNDKLQIKDSTLFNYKKGSKEKNIKNKWLEELRPIFEDEKIKKFGHNIKFDIKVMKNNGVEVAGVKFDTMVASYLLNPGTRQHSLDAVTFSELGFEKISKEDLLGKGRDKITFSEVETEKLSLYSCEDADFTNRLVKKLDRELKAKKLDKLFYNLEMPLIYVLSKMENNGIKIDNKFLGKIKKEVDGKIKKLEAKIKKISGMDFNINSTQQLREVLFEKLEIPTYEVKKTKTGLSTAADELEKLKDYHPIIKLIQEYRELNKLSTTYINALPELINEKTKRVHTSFNQAVTATGRLSSTEPNLQNIPIRTELGREIRKAFVAGKGNKLISLDYSQIELRLAAHMSGDAKMIKAFKEGRDIHTATAALINNVSLDEVSSKMRREAKAINFGILYGQGPHGLSRSADIPYATAREFIDNYFIKFKGVKKFIDKTIEKAKKDGYVETLFNRRRYLPELNSSMVMVRKGAERMAINTPLQGTAADMIKKAMIEVQKQVCHSGGREATDRISSTKKSRDPIAALQDDSDIKMLLQVHDELLFEVKNNKVDEMAIKIKEIMENVLKLKVPIVVDAKVGDNWGKMETIGN